MYCIRIKSTPYHLVNALWWRSVIGIGLSSGCKRWKVRTSKRSFSGHVVELGFHPEDIEIIKDIANYFCKRYQLRSMKIRSRENYLWVSIPVERSSNSKPTPPTPPTHPKEDPTIY